MSGQQKMYFWYFTLLYWNLCSASNDTFHNTDSLANVSSENFIFNKQDYYVAATVDFAGIGSFLYGLEGLGVQINLQSYLSIIEDCGKSNIDIVVFPECGLYGCVQTSRNLVLNSAIYIPPPQRGIIPCQSGGFSQALLHDLSCAARKSKIYVAVTVMEKFCPIGTTCTKNELLLYSTAVVFDRQGELIARYRKFNLYMEEFAYGVNRTEKPEIVTFTTDFGVTFGIIICFDLLLPVPSIPLIKEYNVKHMVHMSSMLSRLPFLAPNALDAGWSYVMNTTILASSLPPPGSLRGTGIHFGQRENTRVYVKYNQFSKIIVAPVPKNPSLPLQKYPSTFNRMSEYVPGIEKPLHFLVEHVLDRIVTKSIFGRDGGSEATFQYKSGTFECNVSVSYVQTHSPINLPNYRLLAYSGPTNRSIVTRNSYTEMCGLTLCGRSVDNKCHLPPRFQDSSQVLFNSINISAISYSYQPAEDIIIPTNYRSNMMALDVSRFKFSNFVDNSTGKSTNIIDMKLIRPTSDLITFGIYRMLNETIRDPNTNYKDVLENLDFVLNIF